MKYLFLSAAFLCCGAAYSQIDQNYINSLYKKRDEYNASKFNRTLTLELISKQREKESQQAVQANTNAASLLYDRSTGCGFNVYRSQAYRMPVLIPDSSNAASLKMKTVIMPPAGKEFNAGSR